MIRVSRHAAVRALLALGVFAMLAFHAHLLWLRVRDGSLLDAQVAVRWLGAFALVFGLWRLYRATGSMTSGRKATVLWLLVLLLHVAVVPVVPLAEGGELARPLALEPATVLLMTLIAIVWLVLRAFHRGDVSRRLELRRRLLASDHGCEQTAGYLTKWAPRPPPSPAHI